MRSDLFFMSLPHMSVVLRTRVDTSSKWTSVSSLSCIITNFTLVQYHPRTSSHEEETLDDIFNTPSRPAFTTTEDDDDLFKQTSAVEESSVQDMSADDIASYIQQNIPDSNVKLDLF